MDTSKPAVFVNAELLPVYVGKRVKALVQVIQSDGEVTTVKSTDERQLLIKELPHVPPLNYVEVIGIAESKDSIRAETWTNFGDKIDTHSYNQLCQLANGEFKNLFV